MFVCLFVFYGFVCFLILMGHPLEVSLKVSWRSDLIWLRYLGSKNVYLFVCFCIDFFILIILGHPQEVSLKVSWRSNLIWLRCLGSKNVYLFVCLFMDLLLFCLNHLGIPTESYPENFVKIQLNLAEIFRI